MIVPEIEVACEQLANGLDVIVQHNPKLPLVAMNLWYHVGSKEERGRQRGLAHLVEHLMFEGSAHYPGDFFSWLQPLGARINGSTSSDRTNYFVDLPAPHLELAVAIESDRMGALIPSLDQKRLDVQRGVVTNEYRQNYANRPYGRISRIVLEALYGPGHPYRWQTIGAMDDVARTTLEDVEAFLSRFYVPSNASLCFAGHIEPTKAFELADRYFGQIEGGAPAPRLPVQIPALSESISIELREQVELTRLDLVWHSVERFHHDDLALGLLSDILAKGRSSRLYQRLVVETELAQSVSAGQTGRELAGSFGILVYLRPGASRSRIIELVEEELRTIAMGVQSEELERVQHGRLATLIYAMESPGGFGGVADRLNAFNVYRGDPRQLFDEPRRILDVSLEDLSRVARSYLVDPGGQLRPHLMLTTGPAHNGMKEPRSKVPIDRTNSPSPRDLVPFQPPVPERQILHSGLELWVIRRSDLPVVTGSISVPAGATAHATTLGGLATLTASMLSEGTATRSAIELAAETDRIGSRIQSGAGWSSSSISFRTLSAFLRPTLDLVIEMFRAPSFPGREWNRLRGQLISELNSRHDRAEAIASDVFAQKLYGNGHPYSCAPQGTVETLESLGVDQARSFHAERYRPSGGILVIAGDLDPDRVARDLDQLLDSFSGSVEPPSRPKEPRQFEGRRMVLVDRPGAQQAVIQLGHLGIARTDPDYDALILLNQVLGGQFQSRLNERLRESKGMTYGIRSSFDARRGPGPFLIGSSVQSDRVAEAVSDIVSELEGLQGINAVSAEELSKARRGLLEGRVRHFETPSDLVAKYLALFIQGLPIDEHKRFEERLSGVTLEQLNDVAQRRLHPDRLLGVIVADADKVGNALESLHWDHFECLSADQH